MVPGIVLEANQKSEHDHVAKVPKSYLPSGSVTVSYTHLDVYKRQLKEQLDSYSGDKRLGIFYTRTTDTNPTPVSYTHLDVYKRQDQLSGAQILSHTLPQSTWTDTEPHSAEQS